MLFEAAIEIPDRPENFFRPDAYAGPTVDLNKYVGSSAVTWSKNDNKGNAALVTTWNKDPAIDAKNANRIGYIYASNDAAATAAVNVGHVFGRLG